MIRYTLVCEAAHNFEGWFRNSDDFEAQCKRKLVVCPMCGATNVKKGLMAPAVSTSRNREASPLVVSPENNVSSGTPAAGNAAEPAGRSVAAPMQPSALLPENLRQKEIVEALRLVRTRIIENSENVGSNFASEARKIHYGDAEERSIYGETTPQDAEELLEEGISVLPLPELPDDKN